MVGCAEQQVGELGQGVHSQNSCQAFVGERFLDSHNCTFCLNKVELELADLSWSSVLVDSGQLVEDGEAG